LKEKVLLKDFLLTGKKVADAMALAHRDAKTSRAILPSNQDWAYTIAYKKSTGCSG
jgi:hypothetical protein